jgi:hypothetical protein
MGWNGKDICLNMDPEIKIDKSTYPIPDLAIRGNSIYVWNPLKTVTTETGNLLCANVKISGIYALFTDYRVTQKMFTVMDLLLLEHN